MRVDDSPGLSTMSLPHNSTALHLTSIARLKPCLDPVTQLNVPGHLLGKAQHFPSAPSVTWHYCCSCQEPFVPNRGCSAAVRASPCWHERSVVEVSSLEMSQRRKPSQYASSTLLACSVHHPPPSSWLLYTKAEAVNAMVSARNAKGRGQRILSSHHVVVGCLALWAQQAHQQQ